MSVTPQLKDKVEFSLDNRQIFFLFFGMSVVGCFVFAMGVMVGKRGELLPLPGANQQANVVTAEDVDDVRIAAADYAFKDGLLRPATDDVPETRDPSVPPRDEAVVRAERDAASAKPQKKPGSTKKLPAIPAPTPKDAAKPVPNLGGTMTAEASPPAAKSAAPAEAKPAAVPPAAAKPLPPPPGDEVLLAAVKPSAAVADSDEAKARNKKGWTLQMKAFSVAADAEKLADKLRRNGHEVRIESGEANGRMWHRVRMGEFESWDAALNAKTAFEKSEQVIAYVVSL